MSEFEGRVSRCRARPGCPVRQRVFAPESGLWMSIALYCGPSAWSVAACNLARFRAPVVSLHEGLPMGKNVVIKTKGAPQTVLLHVRINECRLRITPIKLWFSPKGAARPKWGGVGGDARQ